MRLAPPSSDPMVRQCAWCRRVADGDGRYHQQASSLIGTATHGCCAPCARTLLRQLARHRAGSARPR